MKPIFLLMAFAILLAACSTKIPEKPNVVIILADDMGYGDVQALNENSKIPTPNLNGLAAEGVTFTDAHTPSAVCTPTRYGLVTGRYCWRSRLKKGVLNGYGEPLIETERPTIGSLLKSAGYNTGIIGKWHLGLGFQKDADGKFDFSLPVTHSPNDVGFDYSYVIPASLDFPPYVYVQNHKLTEFPSEPVDKHNFPAFWRKGERSPEFVMEETLDHLVGKAKNYIEENANKEKPFLLYFPLTAPHKPVIPHERFRGKTECGPYGDFVHQVDYSVGEVLKKLDELKIADNTIVIFTSDNGSYMYRYPAFSDDHVSDETIQGFAANNHTANGVFRGTKADIYDAGHHVPFFVRWPETLEAGKTVTNTVCLTDIFATLSEIVKAPKPDGSAEDSYSFNALLGDNSAEYSRAPVIHHSVGGMFAIRKGDWKLVLGNGSGGRELPRGKNFQEPYQLYNMKEDVGETNDVISKHPEIAAELEKECLTIKGDD